MSVRPDDIPWLVERYAAEWNDVDFAWLWGGGLGEWTIPLVSAVIWWTPDGRRAAYTVTRGGRSSCRLLLAEDPDLARDVLATVRPASLDHHPSGWLARNALDPAWAVASVKTGDPAMACELQPGVLAPYVRAVSAGQRAPGFVMFPLPFMAC
jgi:hypothetical protein